MATRWLALILVTVYVQAFDYSIKPNFAICFWEEVAADKLIIAEFLAKTDRSEYKTLNLMVFNPSREILFAKNEMSMFIFSHVALEAGSYQFCIKNEGEAEFLIEVNIKTGAEARDFLHLATTSDFRNVEGKITRAEKMSEEIHSNL
jgi:hypothetical protein